jgi:putative phage-type endonuclease
MMSFETIETANRAEWLKARRAGIGASDIAAIMGISPWSTPFQVWASKVSDVPDDEGSESMKWGRVLENVILDEWAKENRFVTNRGRLIRSVETPIMMATPDGFTTTPYGLPTVAEAKNRSEWSWDSVPEYYYAQVQWQLAVTSFALGYLIVLFAGRHLETFEIKADMDYQTAQMLAADEFWIFVEDNEPPPTDGADNPLLASLWPSHVEQAVEISPDAAVELYEARSADKVASGRRDAAEAAIKATLGDADTAVVDQQVIATWRNNGKGRRFLVKGEGLDD